MPRWSEATEAVLAADARSLPRSGQILAHRRGAAGCRREQHEITAEDCSELAAVRLRAAIDVLRADNARTHGIHPHAIQAKPARRAYRQHVWSCGAESGTFYPARASTSGNVATVQRTSVPLRLNGSRRPRRSITSARRS